MDLRYSSLLGFATQIPYVKNFRNTIGFIAIKMRIQKQFE
jgi:hypothetical protein